MDAYGEEKLKEIRETALRRVPLSFTQTGREPRQVSSARHRRIEVPFDRGDYEVRSLTQEKRDLGESLQREQVLEGQLHVEEKLVPEEQKLVHEESIKLIQEGQVEDGQILEGQTLVQVKQAQDEHSTVEETTNSQRDTSIRWIILCIPRPAGMWKAVYLSIEEPCNNEEIVLRIRRKYMKHARISSRFAWRRVKELSYQRVFCFPLLLLFDLTQNLVSTYLRFAKRGDGCLS